jgi:hypothetical protein
MVMLSAALGDKKGVSVVSKASSLSLEFIHCLNCWISAITAVGLCDHGLHCLLLITVWLLSITAVGPLRSRLVSSSLSCFDESSMDLSDHSLSLRAALPVGLW